MIHTDIILGVNNKVQLQHMLLFQDVLAQQAGFTHPGDKYMNKLPQGQQGWGITLLHLLCGECLSLGSYSMAHVR